MSLDKKFINQPPEPDMANEEWQLHELIGALSGEIDRATQLASLKSLVRPVTAQLQDLSLELSVFMRVGQDGRVFFRGAQPGEKGSTQLKIDLSQLTSDQLEDIRRPLEREAVAWPLEALDDINQDEIAGLNRLAIFSRDDLLAFAATPVMLTELGRQTCIREDRLRRWLDFPYISRLNPPNLSFPLSEVVIEGGNFGNEPDPEAKVFFGEIDVDVRQWSPNQLHVRAPTGIERGPVYVVIDGAPTNAVLWLPAKDSQNYDLEVSEIQITLPSDTSRLPVLFYASVLNKSEIAVPDFEHSWIVDGGEAVTHENAGLAPGETRTLEFAKILSAGVHEIRCAIDPYEKLPLTDRSKALSSLSFEVGEEQPVADLRVVELSLTPASPLADEDVHFQARISNYGVREVGPFQFQWSIHGEAPLIQGITGLAPGSDIRLPFSRKFEAGNYLLTFEIDPFHELSLDQRTEAVKTIRFSVAAPSRGALQIEKHSTRGSGPFPPGEVIVFETKIANAGDVDLVQIGLVDHFDARALSYRSATPPPDQRDGDEKEKLIWRNMGRLSKGQSKIVAVEFQCLSVPRRREAFNLVETTDVQDSLGDVPGASSRAVVFVNSVFGEVSGIGTVREQRLLASGIERVAQLAATPPAKLAAILGVGKKQAQKIANRAKSALRSGD